MSLMRALCPVVAALCVSAASGTAHALVVTARENGAAVVGTAVEFTATAMGAGAITYTWDFGDGTRLGPMDSATLEHTFTAPGHYVVIVIAKDDSGVRSDSFVQTVHHPLTAQAPAASSTIVYDAARDRVCTVNPDHDSVSCLEGATLTRSFETGVGEHPRTLALDDDGALWVTDDGASSISIVDASGAPAGSVALPYGAHPFGIVKSPTSDVMYVAASGTGQLIAISTTTRTVVASVDVGPSATGVAVSGDGERVLVTRFLSPVDHGEVTEVSASRLEVVRRFALAENSGPDTEATSRGVPNYLRSVLVTPDGRSAWVLSKQDNVARGVARDGMPLTFETTTRTVLSVLDLEQNQERADARVDINNRSLGLAGALTPVGDYLFVALLGTNGVDVLDTFDGNSVGGRRELGAAPDGVALGANGRLYVHAFLSRSVLVLDASGVLASTDFSLPLLMEAQAVASERLDADVLQGKRIFYDASDTRMARDGYITCATCHLDGDSDGRVWDFTSRGEGLRNTTSLLGKRGTGQGPLHWTANFDEVQDFEHDIRNAFGGSGFMSDADFMTGTRNQTLGDPKAGVSAELDALAAYLESLDEVPASPFRDQDGTLTEDGWAGHALFETAGCLECHGGPDFTDSPEGVRHDVGTLSATSGQRLGAELDGLDTPTLRGTWHTAPYLHDGSAATLLEAIASPDDRHGRTRELSAQEREQLVSYLLQIDNTRYEEESELAAPQAEAGSGAAGAEVAMRDGAIDEAQGVPVVGAPSGSSSSEGGGGCSVSARPKTTATPLSALAFAFAILCVRAPRGLPSRLMEKPMELRAAVALLISAGVTCLALGCQSDESPTGAGEGGSTAVPSVGGSGGASGPVGAGGVGGTVAGTGGIGSTPIIPGGTAGMNTGGMPALGGASGAMAGAGAGAPGGAGGMAGADAGETMGAAVPSDGCGKALATLTTGTHSITSSNTEREYTIDIPADYDPQKPYRLIFAWHWINASDEAVVSGQTANGGPVWAYYGLKNQADSAGDPAIFIAPQSRDGRWDEQDHVLFDDLLALARSELCIDTSRVFATGFSFGAMHTYSLSTNHQMQLRAVSALSPANFNIYLPTNTHQPIAYMSTTGMGDTLCPWDGGPDRGALYAAIGHAEDNGCTLPDPVPTTTTGSKTFLCHDFTGCQAGYPVKACTFDGGHIAAHADGGTGDDGVETWIPRVTWEFFTQF